MLMVSSRPYHNEDAKANLMRSFSEHSPPFQKSAELFLPLFPSSFVYDGTASVPLGVSILLK